MLNLDDESVIDFAKFLIEKGANVNIADVELRTPLHILAANKI
jgi:ankyrin repeat protein